MATPDTTRPPSARQVAIRDAYLAGDPMERIAADLGVGVGTVHRELKRLGVPARGNLKPIPAGTRFGALAVVRHLGGCEWLCLCDCGREEAANASGLRLGRKTRCSACRLPEKPPERKTCTRCGVEYPNTPEFFLRNSQFRLGLEARCKKCRQPKINRDAKKRVASLRREVLSHYSGGGEPRCVCCGEAILGLLALDHLEGSSQEDYRTFGSVERFFSHVKKEGFELRAQTLCHNCNSCKSVYGSCLHQGPIDPLAHNRSNKRRLELPPVTGEEVSLAFGRTRACRVCGRTFPRSGAYFPKHPTMGDGLLNLCKDCDRKNHFRQAKLRRERDKAVVLRHYCGELPFCSCCGITHPEFLTVDHIDGGGQKHRKEEKIGNFWKWVIDNDFPADLRIQCYSCNMGRSFNGGTCPHDTK